jgi:hypothetical protein
MREHTTALPRSEARRQFRPRVLQKTEPARDDAGEILRDKDGEVVVVVVPVLDDQGHPVLGPDPLGHLSEEDWQGSNQALAVTTREPSREERVLAGLKQGMRIARDNVLRLLAVIVTPNEELEEWETNGQKVILDELDRVGRDLLFKTKGHELLQIALTAAEVIHDQFAPTVSEAGDAWGKLETFFGRRPSEESATATPPGAGPAPMVVEHVGTPGTDERPGSSSESREDSEDGRASRSSTEPAGASSSPSGTA